MDFEEYCTSKKINYANFKENDSVIFNEYKLLFDQISPKSFTQQKLFQINAIRKKFLLGA